MFLGVWYIVCVLTMTSRAVCGGEYVHTIYVDPERGNNSPVCLNSSSPSHPCRNLNYAFQYCNSSTQYLLQPGTHYLNSTASFTNRHNIAITGNGNVGAVMVVCADNSGLSFINTENISIVNLDFMHCSSQQNSTSFSVSSPIFQLLYTRSALYFYHCATISMYHVAISGSSDTNAITAYNSIGTNNFTRCVFSNNTGLTDCSSYLAGGGGVYIEFSYCLPGNTSCENGTEISYTDYNEDSMYIFTECEFSNNSACADRDALRWFISYRQYHTAFGQGGGLSIYFCGNATNNSIQVTNCTFSGNRAMRGAGMFVEFADNSVGNSVIVSGRECNFFNNTCNNFDGGGMRVSHFLFNATCGFKGNSVNITSCNFSMNKAINGGGLHMASLPQEEDQSQLFNLIISKVTFDSNQGQFGAALGMTQFDFLLKGKDPRITITNCTFRNNTVHPHYTGPHEVGRGALYSDGVDMKFCGTNLFHFNYGTALVMISATAYVADSHLFFFKNSGLNGGAIALLESARLLINDNTSMCFDHNIAYVSGGAIYKEHHNQAEIKNCLVMHKNLGIESNPNEWNANFTFGNNFDSAGLSKNAIFSTSILPCAFTGINTVFCWKHWVYSYNGVEDKNCSKFIRTAPGNITITDSVFHEATPIPTISAYPGEIIQLPIVVYDDLNHSVQTVFTADGYSDSHSTSAMLDMNYVYTADNSIRVLGNSGGSLLVNLQTLGARQWHVKLRVNLTECPPGLLPTPTPGTDNTSTQIHEEDHERDNSSSCECNPQETFANLVQCNSATTASLASGYWMGEWMAADGREFYAVSSCPSGFCQTARTGFSPLPRKNLSEHICGVHNRMGRVCGECIEGYGPALNSEVYKCVYCSVSKHRLAMHATYYILAVYVPLFLLFLAIIVFNIKLTTGPANAFILYSQVISSTMNINADGRLSLDSITPDINRLLKAYKFPYGIFNLKFFEHFVPPEYMCLGTQLNVLDIFLLDYLVAFFPLLMVIAITIHIRIADYCSVCYRIFPRCKKGPSSGRLRNALIPAFASFILLSYTKFSLTSSYVFSFVVSRNASGHYVWPLHVNFAAQYAFNDKEYILRYLLPSSMVFLTFASIPPLILLNFPLRLFEKLLKQFPRIWRHYPYSKVHSMLDAFQGCYKNRLRCFAGLYFVFRLLINVTNAMFDDLQQFILQEVYCIVFALLVALLKPYKRNYHLLNYVDSLIFLNLAVINLITLFLYADTRTGINPSIFAFSVQYILLFLPLLYMVSYVAWCVLPIPNIRARVKEWLAIRQQYQPLENLIQDMTPKLTDDVDWERAEDINCYNPAKFRDSPLHSSIPAPGSETFNVRSSCTTPSGDRRRGLSRRRSYESIKSSITASINSASDDTN